MKTRTRTTYHCPSCRATVTLASPPFNSDCPEGWGTHENIHSWTVVDA